MGPIIEQVAEEIQKLNQDVMTTHSLSQLQTDIQDEFTKMVGVICGATPTLSLSSITAAEILRSLTLYMDGDSRREIGKISLGLQNALYLTLLSIQMEKQEIIFARTRQPFIPTVALEEPEAHLHPHLQRLIFGHFLSKARERKQPVIITTHSPHLATTADIRDIVMFHNDCKIGCNAISAYSFLNSLDERQRKDLSRFLDITKAEMLFAKGVIFVEGDVEALLVNEFAEILDKKLDRLGISVCNVSGVHFEHVARLAQNFNIPYIILTDGDKFIKVKGIDRAFILLNEIAPRFSQCLQKLHDGGRKGTVDKWLRKKGIFMNEWTLEVELIHSGLHQAMKEVFIELGQEIDVNVGVGAKIDTYLASQTDDNMEDILKSIDDSRWGKGRYAHRLINHIRCIANELATDNERQQIVPEYIRAGIDALIAQVNKN